jgi:osmotically-inducible protein OsmY
MTKTLSFLLIGMFVALSIFVTGCPKAVDERIRESTNVGLDEATHARDLAIKAAVEGSLMGDPALKWYADTYGGLTVEVSHAVVTVQMKVKTQEQHDQIIQLARSMKDVRDVVDNVQIDPAIEDPPFEW